MCDGENPDSIVDITGFTVVEKLALSNAWRVISRNLQTHAIQAHVDFFNENYDLISGFREPETDEIHLKALCSHPMSIMQFYERAIHVAIYDPINFWLLLQTITDVHKRYQVTKGGITLLAYAMTDYFKKILAHYNSPTLNESLEKMAAGISDNYNKFRRTTA